MTPPPAKMPKKSVERNGWKKCAAKGNQYPSSGPVLRSHCLFFKLPPEIRFMIYSDLVRSGDLGVLGLCQRIHREALEVVYREGIHRVKAYKTAYGDGIHCVKPYKTGGRTAHEIDRISDKVQNVEIYAHLSAFTQSGYETVNSLEALHPELKNTAIRRKNCWIYLTHVDFQRELHRQSRLFIVLRLSLQFDNIFLNIHLPITSYPERTDPRGLNVLANFERQFKALGKEMEPFFGASAWHDSPDPMYRYWTFHPYRARLEGY